MFKSHVYPAPASLARRNTSSTEVLIAKALARVSLAALSLLLQGGAIAQEPEVSEPAFFAAASSREGSTAAPSLERAFWICDHGAARETVDSQTAIACSEITEALKLAKFNGDYEAMLAWWQQNKAAEHAALEPAAEAEPPLP